MSRRTVVVRGAVVLGCTALLGVAGCSSGSKSASRAPEPTASSTSGPDAALPGSAGVAAPAPSQVEAHRPTALALPSGQVVPVDASATGTNGELAIPTDVDRAGWWDGSARLGDPFGGIVVAAHVDSFDGLGRFAELLTVRRGDEIQVAAGRLSQRFRVVSADLVPKSKVDADADIYSVRGASRLVLITCGGSYDPANGGYQDNLVVVARPDGPIDTAR